MKVIQYKRGIFKKKQKKFFSPIFSINVNFALFRNGLLQKLF